MEQVVSKQEYKRFYYTHNLPTLFWERLHPHPKSADTHKLFHGQHFGKGTVSCEPGADLYKHAGQVIGCQFRNQTVMRGPDMHAHEHIIGSNHVVFLAQVFGDGKVGLPCSVLIGRLQSQPAPLLIRAQVDCCVEQNQLSRVGFCKKRGLKIDSACVPVRVCLRSHG